MALQVKEIVASRSVRINTGDYQGTEYFASMKAEIGEFDDPEEEMAELGRLVERSMMTTLVRSYRVRKKDVSQATIGRLHGMTYSAGEKEAT